MATREENLKKINEELEKVAGCGIFTFDRKNPVKDGIYNVETEKILKNQNAIL